LQENFGREGAGAMAVRKSRLLHPNEEIDERARRLGQARRAFWQNHFEFLE
jgi:hypothetical protein